MMTDEEQAWIARMGQVPESLTQTVVRHTKPPPKMRWECAVTWIDGDSFAAPDGDGWEPNGSPVQASVELCQGWKRQVRTEGE